jgi:hypothetical protein
MQIPIIFLPVAFLPFHLQISSFLLSVSYLILPVAFVLPEPAVPYSEEIFNII